MKVERIRYARMVFLPFNDIQKLVCSELIIETEKTLKKIANKSSATDLLTIGNNFKKVDLKLYENTYKKNLKKIEGKIKKVADNQNIKKCIEYNNYTFYDMAFFQNIASKKRKSHVIKTLCAYLLRMACNPVYGGLYGFMTYFNNKSANSNKVGLKIIEEKNLGFIKKNSKNNFGISPSLGLSKSKVIVFSYIDKIEKIVKITNKELWELTKNIKDKKIKLSYNSFLKNKVVNSKDKYTRLIGKLEDIGIISRLNICINQFYFNIRNRRMEDIENISNIKIKRGYTYDYLNYCSVFDNNILKDDISNLLKIYLNLINKLLDIRALFTVL